MCRPTAGGGLTGSTHAGTDPRRAPMTSLPSATKTLPLADDGRQDGSRGTAHASTRRNIRLLTIAQALGGASPPIIVSLGGLVGPQLAPNPALITLPVSLYNPGLAVSTLPAAYLMCRLTHKMQTGPHNLQWFDS